MEAEQVLCRKCHQPFMSQGTFKQISKIISEKGIEQFRDSLMLCQKCRREAFAQQLVGNHLQRVTRVPYVAKHRSERIKPIRIDPKTGATVYKSECFICNSGCDATVWVKKGKVIKVEGDPSSSVTKGTLCAKGLASKYLLYHPDRLKYPIKRVGEKGEGKWQRISWDEALDTIATRFKDIEREYGKDAVALAQGTSRGWIPYFSRFANAWGKQWTGPGIAQCALPRMTGSKLVAGSYAMECPDYEHTQCMIVWGG